VPEGNECLLGRDLCAKLGIRLHIPGRNSNKINALSSNIQEKYKDYFSDGFKSNVKECVSLPMKDNVTPVFQKTRSVPLRYKDKIHTELKRLQQLGVIKPKLSSAWASPIVSVLKSNGVVRICGDYANSINKYLETTRYPLPTIDEVRTRVGNASYFSKIDLCSAFLQVPLDEKSKAYTTINTPEGLFEYQYLPMGTSCSPALFHELLCRILNGIDNCVIYQDEILLMSSNETEHNDLLEKVLDTLKSAGIKN